MSKSPKTKTRPKPAFSTESANNGTNKYRVEFTYTVRDAVIMEMDSIHDAWEASIFIPEREKRIRRLKPEGFHVESVEPVGKAAGTNRK